MGFHKIGTYTSKEVVYTLILLLVYLLLKVFLLQGKPNQIVLLRFEYYYFDKQHVVYLEDHHFN